MILKKSQENDILKVLRDGGVAPDDFAWTTTKEVLKPKLRKFFGDGAALLCYKKQPWISIAIWYTTDRAGSTEWALYYSPDQFEPTGAHWADSFDGLLPVVSQWLTYAKRELAESRLWPEGTHPEQTEAVLLPSRLNEIFRELAASPVDLQGAVWSGDTREVLLSNLPGDGSFKLVRTGARWVRYHLRPNMSATAHTFGPLPGGGRFSADPGKWKEVTADLAAALEASSLVDQFHFDIVDQEPDAPSSAQEYVVCYSPAEQHPSGTESGLDWQAVLESLRKWSRWLAKEQQAHLSPVVASIAPKCATLPTRVAGLRLDGIRAFEGFSLPFSDGDGSPRMTTLLIGPNGAGKSTLLRAIALALCPKVDANVLLSLPQAGLVDLGKDSATIELDLRADGEFWTRRLLLRRDSEREEVVEESGDLPEGLFIYASGSGRAVESLEESRRPTYRALNAVKSLFAYDTPMATAELTLRRAKELNEEGYPALLESLKSALGLTSSDIVDLPRGGGVLIDGPTTGRPIPLSMWADGYRLTMSWLLDLFAQALAADHTQPDQTAGLLLIDEVERHLHPALQAALLDRLRQALPNMQIVATTHSPMTALGALDGDLVVLQIGDDRKVRALPGLRNPALSVEDLVTDERGFDAAPYAPEIQEKLDEYNQLAVLDPGARSRQQGQRLAALATELSMLEVLDT